METDLKQLVENYKGRMRQLKGLLKTDLSPVERNVVNMVIREERDEYGRIRRQTKRQNKHMERDLRKDIKAVEKQRSKRKRELIKKIRKTIKDERKQANVARREVAKLRKTARIRSKGVVKHEVLKNLVSKYQSKIMEELVDVAEADREREGAKEQEKIAKERAKMEKAAEKEQKKMAKLAEREHARETKKRMQEEKKAAREQEKLAKKAARKTRKNSG